MAVVYIHRKATDGEVFYIGVGKDKKRAYSKYSRNEFWHNVVNKHGYQVEIFKEDIPYECAFTWEKILIAKYGRRDMSLGTLTNLTDGGKNPINLNEQIRRKIGSSIRTLEMRMNLSNTNIRVDPKDINKDVREGNYIKRKVIKLDIENKFICEYSSLADAYRQTGVRQGNIYLVCKGGRMIAGGFKWKYKE